MMTQTPEKVMADDNLRNTQKRIDRLWELEKRVQNGLKTFIEVGEAILEIRDSELWRLPGFMDWESYCKATWNFGRSRASQLISAAKKARRVQDVTGLTIANERVARELNSILSNYNDSVQEVALDALAQRGGELTPARLQNELDVLVEYKTTGHVTRADGEQSALDSAIKTGRKEFETGKRKYIAQNVERTVRYKNEQALLLDSIPVSMNLDKQLKRQLKKGDKVHVSVWIEQGD